MFNTLSVTFFPSYHRRSQHFPAGVHSILAQKSDDLFSHHPLTYHMRVRLTMSTAPPPFYVIVAGAPHQIHPSPKKIAYKKFAVALSP